MDTNQTPQAPPRRKRSITAREMGRRSAKARMISLTPERRSEIARQAIQTRWARVNAQREAAEAAVIQAQAEVARLTRKKRTRIPSTAA